MVYRNMIEFDAEDYNWEKVAEVRGSRFVCVCVCVFVFVLCVCVCVFFSFLAFFCPLLLSRGCFVCTE